jgi:glycosyltransferase involved in cell wall biosynthesis
MGSTVFTGAVPHADTPNYFNMLTVAVFPSIRDSESFGVSVIEAGACGLPVVVSRVGGLKEVVQHQVTGFVVERCNPFETAAAIEELVLNPAMCTKMGEAGLLHVRRHYEWAQNVQHMLSIYDEIIEQHV